MTGYCHGGHHSCAPVLGAKKGPSVFLADSYADALRTLLDAILEAAHRNGLDADAYFEIVGALDELVDPLDPPAPWATTIPVTDIPTALAHAHTLVGAAIEHDRPAEDLIALGLCGRRLAIAHQSLHASAPGVTT